MSQTTLTDEDLFGEAADEIRADIESCLEAARAELPSEADIWDVDADNVLGVLNTLRSALDVESAREHLHDAKKWYVIGDRADAFDDGETLEAEIQELESTIDQLESARTSVSDLINTIPELRSALAEGGADEDA